jgi:glycosyltransferase involved in cell wall biosynthesis
MYPPHSFGGYELAWQAAVEHLRGRGHEVRVLTTDTDTGTEEPDAPDVHRELRWRLRDAQFVPVRRRDKLTLARQNHAVLARHLADQRPDVVGWWAMGGLTLTMIESVRRRGLPAVAFVIDDWLDYGRHVDGWFHAFRGRRRLLAPVVEPLVHIPVRVDFDAAASYVFTSERTRRHAADAGVHVSRTSVAPCGIHADLLDPAPPQPWAWRLLYVGRLDPRKGVETAIAALVHLPEAQLTLIGGWDPQEEARLRERAHALGVEPRVTFAGHRNRHEIAAAYGEHDVTLFPVIWEEPWGLVPLESMARGRPVIATGRGGSAEYLRDGENALLFEAEDERALAAAVTRLADDADLRARIVAGGLATAPKHTEAVLNEAAERELLAAVS